MEEALALSLLSFFADRPEEEVLGRSVTQWIVTALPQTTVRVQKTQITFQNRHVFAALSLPRRARDRAAHALTLTLGLPVRLDTPRVRMTAEPYPGRWTHHLLLSGPRDLDEELLGWVRAAAAFAQNKGTPPKEVTP